MTRRPARKLILGYAAMWALVYFYVLIPGDSVQGGSVRSALFWIALQALVVWRLWLGSPGAWLLALCLNLLGIASVVLIGSGPELALVLVVATTVTQLVILVSGPVRAHVWARP